MLRNAKLYQEELAQLEQEYRYDDDYKFIDARPTFSTYSDWVDDGDTIAFVSLNNEEEILGFMGAGVDWMAMSVSNFMACSYGGSSLYARDLCKFIDMLFMQFNLNRISWSCYADNPALDGYEKLVTRVGGKRVGYLTQDRLLKDGMLHDTVIFEIMRKDYLAAKED